MIEEEFGNYEMESIQYNSVFIGVYYVCARHCCRHEDVAINRRRCICPHIIYSLVKKL